MRLCVNINTWGRIWGSVPIGKHFWRDFQVEVCSIVENQAHLQSSKPESGHQNDLVGALELTEGPFFSDGVILAAVSIRKVCPIEQ